MKLVKGAAAGTLVIALTACLEPPVSESLAVRMLRGGASVVSVSVTLRRPSDFDKRPKVRERLESETRALEQGTDAWSPRLAAAEPDRVRDVRDFEEGRLFRVVRHARLEGPDGLRAFFRDTGVDVAYAAGDGWEELTILPGRDGRPTRAQRERVHEELDAFSASLAAYFSVAADLYAYLDRYPERAPTCFASLLDEVPEGDALSDEETELTKAVDAAMGACGRVLEPMEDEPYTIDELSRLVYDPFPAPLRLVVSGKVLEREGFPGGAEGPLQVPAASLWSAFVSLEGRWLEPDPALALWRENAASGRKTIDVTGIASLSRHFARPKPDDVRAAIEGQLRQPPVYRVRWEASEDEVPALPFDDAP